MNAIVVHDSVRALTLAHYTKDPDIIVPGTFRQEVGWKPAGLWVSVLGPYDWKWWCEAEEFMVDTLANAHRVTLSASARILHLSGAEAIRAFDRRYGIDHYYGRRASLREVNWGSVEADGYHGIVISPYCWELRLDHRVRWYYPWDCASGCIWNADAIASVALMENENVER